MKKLFLVLFLLFPFSLFGQIKILQTPTGYTAIFGPFVDPDDVDSRLTGLTINNSDIEIYVDGAWSNSANTDAAVHTQNGWYTKEFDATDFPNNSTSGQCKIDIVVSGAVPVYDSCEVIHVNSLAILIEGDLATFDDIEALTDAILARLPTELTGGLIKSSIQSVEPASINDTAFSRSALDRLSMQVIGAITSTSIAAVNSQLSFTVTNGPSENDIPNLIGGLVKFTDVSSEYQVSYSRVIDYVASTKTVIISSVPSFTIAAGDFVTILPAVSTTEIFSGTAQAGGNATITLNTEASSSNNIYAGQMIWIKSGTGAPQTRIIQAYNGSTKVATVNRPWVTNPDSTSVFAIYAP